MANEPMVIVPISHIGKEIVLIEDDRHDKAVDIAVRLGLRTMSQVVCVCLDVAAKLLDSNKERETFDAEAQRVKSDKSVVSISDGKKEIDEEPKPEPIPKPLPKPKAIKQKKDRPGRPRRFSDEQIRAIREEKAEGATLKELAQRFDCATNTIARIYRREVYTDVTDRDWG